MFPCWRFERGRSTDSSTRPCSSRRRTHPQRLNELQRQCQHFPAHYDEEISPVPSGLLAPIQSHSTSCPRTDGVISSPATHTRPDFLRSAPTKACASSVRPAPINPENRQFHPHAHEKRYRLPHPSSGFQPAIDPSRYDPSRETQAQFATDHQRDRRFSSSSAVSWQATFSPSLSTVTRLLIRRTSSSLWDT